MYLSGIIIDDINRDDSEILKGFHNINSMTNKITSRIISNSSKRKKVIPKLNSTASNDSNLQSKEE